MTKRLINITRNILLSINIKKAVKFFLVFLVLIYIGSYLFAKHIFTLYYSQESTIIEDRNGNEMQILPNAKGQFMRPSESLPEKFSDLLIKKEDRFFFYHLGINPFSIIRSLTKYPFTRRFDGSSTLTQQLVKNLLGNENQRTIGNKIVESLYAISLELHSSKSEIIKMYADIAYFGNQAEGIKEASLFYFNQPPESLNTTQILELLATLSNPSHNPKSVKSKQKTFSLGKVLGITIDADMIGGVISNQNDNPYKRINNNIFEIKSLNTKCVKPCKLTIDNNLTNTIREILQTNLNSPVFASAKNGAVVVLRFNNDANENELLAIVGSPDPEGTESGYQINMATRARPIGSTAKPFFYAKAFEKGARPYTKVSDIEYRYDIGTGYALYPKNYDGKYRGIVTLHEALSNSLNVPAVLVLQYVGVDKFYDFLENDLYFTPFQPYSSYELSIALGGLEMDPLTLSNYFSIFPNQGILKPLRVSRDDVIELPMSKQYETHSIIAPEYVQLINKILSDRITGVEQFGLKGNLNLPAQNYAVKTGTSYDYHDSWTIGYTPDFLVGVWLGNSDNKPMFEFSGSVGAGKIWHEVMETLLNSNYNRNTNFDFSDIEEFTLDGNADFGLEGDDYEVAMNVMERLNLILKPHNLDVLGFTNQIKVPLISSEEVKWYVNNKFMGSGNNIIWQPANIGMYKIRAMSANGKNEEITVTVNNEDY